jgi:hypothetical protein
MSGGGRGSGFNPAPRKRFSRGGGYRTGIRNDNSTVKRGNVLRDAYRAQADSLPLTFQRATVRALSRLGRADYSAGVPIQRQRTVLLPGFYHSDNRANAIMFRGGRGSGGGGRGRGGRGRPVKIPSRANCEIRSSHSRGLQSGANDT